MLLLCAAGVALAFYWFCMPSWVSEANAAVKHSRSIAGRAETFIKKLGEGQYSLVITEGGSTKKYHCVSSLNGGCLNIFYRQYAEAFFTSEDGKNSGAIEAFITFDGTPYIREKGGKQAITEDFLSSLMIKRDEREIIFSLRISS